MATGVCRPKQITAVGVYGYLRNKLTYHFRNCIFFKEHLRLHYQIMVCHIGER